MTQAEPCPGPYRSANHTVYQRQDAVHTRFTAFVRNVYTAEPIVLSDAELCATARLLAASWDMREALRMFGGCFDGLADEFLTELASNENALAIAIRAARAALAEIDGVTEQRK